MAGHLPTVRLGTVATGDAIIAESGRKGAILATFPHAVCVDMETAAVAQVAESCSIPWAAVRIISDQADDSVEVGAIIEFAAVEGAELIAGIIASICA